MGLSKRYIDKNENEVSFSFRELADAVRDGMPDVVFACVLGSTAERSVVKPHSDLDLALYLDGEPSLEIYEKAQEICTAVVGPVRCDLGILNRAEPVYRFEALKGRLLFTRDEEKWLAFFSLTCREYESRIFSYERQRRYRLEAHQ